jgi:hypothetical protein
MVPVSGAAQEAVESPFFLPTPEGWRTETLLFPLDFAPELEYEGLEELRFSPGMFKEMEVDFWSYAFLWWVPEGTSLDTQRLEKDLEAYFRGLTAGVAQAKGLDPGEPKFKVQLEPDKSDSSDHRKWKGIVHTFDVVTTQSPIRLNVRIDILECPEQGNLAALFRLSPQPFHNQIWKVIDDIRQGFRCTR